MYTHHPFYFFVETDAVLCAFRVQMINNYRQQGSKPRCAATFDVHRFPWPTVAREYLSVCNRIDCTEPGPGHTYINADCVPYVSQ